MVVRVVAGAMGLLGWVMDWAWAGFGGGKVGLSRDWAGSCGLGWCFLWVLSSGSGKEA